MRELLANVHKICLRPKRDYSVRKHHPWVFSGAIADVAFAGSGKDSASPLSGETVEVVSAEGETLGYGSYSPASQIRVRMLSFDPKRVPDGAFVAELVALSISRRAAFFAPESTTNACRVINAESDGLPGVVVDYYNGHVICQFTSAGAERWKDEIVQSLMANFPAGAAPLSVSARTDVDVRAKEGLKCLEGLECLTGEEPPELIEIKEGDIRYFVAVRKGHKTGFYLDQRDARAAVGAFAKGREVLNCFCYTGGFGLAAAAGGAKHVTQVDISRDALELARRNAELTFGGGPEAKDGRRFDFVEADVFQYLRRCRDEGKAFDLVVLDPPKFAATKSQVEKAARGYKDINLLAMKLLRPNGILATFSCSGAMTSDLFDKVLAEAAVDARRDFQVVGRTRQGADHPVALNFPEGLYLKGVILRRLS